jgi:hypothetical protein
MLQSLRAITWKNIEVIVVDNASEKDYSIIKERFPEIKLIESPTNLGFAGGNNLAIKVCTGDYILLLNNDTVVTPNFIEPLVETFQQNRNTGIVSPKIVFYYSDDIIQYAGTNQISALTCRGKTNGYGQKNSSSYDVVTPTHLAHGACMMMSRELIKKIGVLDEHYFMYYEEYDFCERTIKAGYQIFYNGYSSILHKQSVSIGTLSPLKAYYMTRSRIYFVRKNYSGINKPIALLYNFMLAVPKNVFMEILHGRYTNAGAILKGAFWHCVHDVQPH